MRIMVSVVDNKVANRGEFYLRAAFGLESPKDQMVGAFLLGVVIIASSAISLGATLVLLPIPIFLFFVGVARLLWGVIGS